MRIEQRIDDGATRNVTPLALGSHADEHSLQAAQIGDFPPDISGVANRNLMNLGARVAMAINELQQSPDFVQRKS